MNNLDKLSNKQIENRIFEIRELHIMIDYHLAELFQVETKRLNEQVKRNIKRFPTSFMFQLNNTEWEYLQSQIATTDKNNNVQSQIATTKRRTLPYVFTEQGVAMLSAVLNSEVAINVSIQIIEAFVTMRKILLENALINFRLSNIEQNLLITEQKFEQIFKTLESKTTIASQGVFFNGQVFDAYTFVSDLIRSAKKEIVLIDNYIDDTVLTHFAKRKKIVECTVYTKNISKQLQLDLKKYNNQYIPIKIKEFKEAHDRFLIIDHKEVYHFGASLKDLGKKWFAFSKMNSSSVSILTKIKELENE